MAFKCHCFLLVILATDSITYVHFYTNQSSNMWDGALGAEEAGEQSHTEVGMATCGREANLKS